MPICAHSLKTNPRTNFITVLIILFSFANISNSQHVSVLFNSNQTVEDRPSTVYQEDLPNNAPLKSCGKWGGVEDGEYVDVVTEYMEPRCEEVNGYCRLRKNVNYTAILRFIPRVDIQTLTVRITAVQRGPYGWETLFWPEYSACGKFNITCPTEPFVKVYGFNYDHVPNEIPPSRAHLRLRFLGTSSEDQERKPYLCRELFLQFY